MARNRINDLDKLGPSGMTASHRTINETIIKGLCALLDERQPAFGYKIHPTGTGYAVEWVTPDGTTETIADGFTMTELAAYVSGLGDNPCKV